MTQDIDLIKSLTEMKEDDFTKNILKPLFEAMGYERVDFNGGPFERGRDLIAQIKIPPRRNLRVTYVQSKKIGDIQNVSTGVKLSQLLHQLRQCCSGKITTIDGTELLADEVYLACPEKISPRLMEEIGSQLLEIKPKINFYDGPAIISDIYQYKPDLLNLLTSIKEKLNKPIKSSLINRELLSALKSKKNIDSKYYYSDLSFFVGSIDSNMLLHLEVKTILDKYLLSEDQWKSARKQFEAIEDKYGLKLYSSSMQDIEGEFHQSLDAYYSIENEENTKKLFSLSGEIAELERNIRSRLDSLQQLFIDSDTAKSVHKLSDNDIEIIKDHIKHIRINISTNITIEHIKTHDGNIDIYKKESRQIIQLVADLRELKNNKTLLSSKIIEKPKYIIKIDSNKIRNTLNTYKNEYIESVKRINAGSLGQSSLPKFLATTEKHLSFISTIHSKSSILNSIIQLTYSKSFNDRVSISPHDIFSSHHDIAVYGNAGVGKTTTLQVYAETSHKDSLYYVPLNRVLNKFKIAIQNNENRDILNNDLIIKTILMSYDIEISEEMIKQAKAVISPSMTLILDGLDEIYSAIPEIIPAISIFKEQYPLSQLIISSRDCVSYLDSINFLGITLLPFTREQLNRFIIGWLNNEDKSDSLIASIEKLNLYEHIKTPLLATITCSLVENGIKAPSNENEIYSERLRLLTGEYDLHKNIERQKNKGETLRRIATCLAFNMHESNVRNMTKENILSILKKNLSSTYEYSLICSCIDELIDPCNLIIHDPITNTYSFGHFRFQEHLASCELRLNRSIDITTLLFNDWWRGTLCLYAQDTEFSHLFEDVYNKRGRIGNADITLRKMIDSAPKEKQKYLLILYKRYRHADYLDEITSNDDYDTWNINY